jgi:hypothetical protein
MQGAEFRLNEPSAHTVTSPSRAKVEAAETAAVAASGTGASPSRATKHSMLQLSRYRVMSGGDALPDEDI